MEFWQGLAQLVLGASLTIIGQLVLRAVKQRGRLAGRRHSMLDLAHASRFRWMEESTRLRRLCLDKGMSPEEIGPPPVDPWEDFAAKQALALTGE